MAEEIKPGCQIPPVKLPEEAGESGEVMVGVKKEAGTMIKVGKPAPEFSAPGYLEGRFANFSLSDYKGKWVLLCFYPGDFTFV